MARLAATSVVNLVEPRTFREPRAGVTLFFDRIGVDGRSFEGVFLKLGEDDERNDRVIVARRGALALDHGRLWLDLFASVVHDVDPANPSRYRTNRNEFQRILFSEDIEEAVQSRITYEKGLRAQSLPELLQVVRQRNVSPERRRLALVEIHKKFSIPFACFAFDKLAHAYVGTALQFLGSAIKQDLAFTRFEPAERVEHHDPVGNLLDGPHIMGHNDARHRASPARLEDQLIDHITHDRIEPRGRFVVKHDFGVDGQRPS